MNTLSWKQGPAFLPGIKVVVSAYCYKTKTEVRGIADRRRPNNGVMLFRKVTIRIPTAYLIGDTLVCHPEYERKLRDKIAKQMTESVDQLTRDLIEGKGSASTSTAEALPPISGNSLSDLVEYLKKMDEVIKPPHANNSLSIFRGGWTDWLNGV